MAEPSQADTDRVGTWLRSEARAKTVDQVRDFIDSESAAFEAAVRSFDADGLASPLSPGEWAPIDALKHVVEWTWQNGEDILHTCLTGETPGNPAPSFDAEREGLLRRLHESLDSVWAHVSAADPDDFLEVTWPHVMFGELNWREWYVFLGVHLADHASQLKQATGA